MAIRQCQDTRRRLDLLGASLFGVGTRAVVGHVACAAALRSKHFGKEGDWILSSEAGTRLPREFIEYQELRRNDMLSRAAASTLPQLRRGTQAGPQAGQAASGAPVPRRASRASRTAPLAAASGSGYPDSDALPSHSSRCQQPLGGRDPQPLRHQVVELPP